MGFELATSLGVVIYIIVKKEYKLYIRIGVIISELSVILSYVLSYIGYKNYSSIMYDIGLFALMFFIMIIFGKWVKRFIVEFKEEMLPQSSFEKAEKKYRKTTKKNKHSKRQKHFK